MPVFSELKILGTFFFLLLSCSLLVSLLIDSLKNGITPMPTSPKVKKVLRTLLPPLKKDQLIYELGSGWGSLAFLLARHYPQATIYGYEDSFIPYLFSSCRLLFSKQSNLKFFKKNFFQINLKEAALITCYLYPKAMMRLKEKFEQELSTPTVVISHTFAIPKQIAQQVYTVNDLYLTKIYVYFYSFS